MPVFFFNILDTDKLIVVSVRSEVDSFSCKKRLEFKGQFVLNYKRKKKEKHYLTSSLWYLNMYIVLNHIHFWDFWDTTKINGNKFVEYKTVPVTLG